MRWKNSEEAVRLRQREEERGKREEERGKGEEGEEGGGGEGKGGGGEESGEREGGRRRGRKRRGEGGVGQVMQSPVGRRVLLLLSTVIHLPAATLLSLSLSQEPRETSAQTPALPAARLPGDSLPRPEAAEARSDPARVSPPAVSGSCLHL